MISILLYYIESARVKISKYCLHFNSDGRLRVLKERETARKKERKERKNEGRSNLRVSSR